jgi:hypothetical protein
LIVTPTYSGAEAGARVAGSALVPDLDELPHDASSRLANPSATLAAARPLPTQTDTMPDLSSAASFLPIQITTEATVASPLKMI